jgi:hypothetical protein
VIFFHKILRKSWGPRTPPGTPPGDPPGDPPGPPPGGPPRGYPPKGGYPPRGDPPALRGGVPPRGVWGDLSDPQPRDPGPPLKGVSSTQGSDPEPFKVRVCTSLRGPLLEVSGDPHWQGLGTPRKPKKTRNLGQISCFFWFRTPLQGLPDFYTISTQKKRYHFQHEQHKKKAKVEDRF